MKDQFRQLDEIFAQILQGASAAGRTRTARSIGKSLRASQQRRIRSQRNPDGSQFTKRRRRVLRTQQGLVFEWNGETRRLKNWRHGIGRHGKTITGFDEDRGAIRTFYRADIERWFEINTRRATRTEQRPEPMFRKLRTLRYLKMSADASGTTVGYDGIAGRIARIHQYGQRDEARPGVVVSYPARRLLGFTQADEALITEAVISSLSGREK